MDSLNTEFTDLSAVKNQFTKIVHSNGGGYFKKRFCDQVDKKVLLCLLFTKSVPRPIESVSRDVLDMMWWKVLLLPLQKEFFLKNYKREEVSECKMLAQNWSKISPQQK